MDFAELMSRQEPLLSELRPFIIDGPIGPMLKHPYLFEMVIDVEHSALVNQRFKFKNGKISESYKSKNYSSVLALTERPYRLQEFRKFCNDITDKEYWELLGWIWIDSENIWEMLDIWKVMLTDASRKPTEFRQFMMDEDERKVLNSLPETITIYRGCSDYNKMGFSWTLDKDVATKFSNRLKSNKENRYVIEAKCNKEDVIAYFNGRDEKEIVVNQSKITVMQISKKITCNCSKCNKLVYRFVKSSEKSAFICRNCKAKECYKKCSTCGIEFISKSNKALYCSDCRQKRIKDCCRKARKKYTATVCICCGESKVSPLKKDERENFLCRSCKSKSQEVSRRCHFCNCPISIKGKQKDQIKVYHRECFGLESKVAELLNISRQAVNLAISREIDETGVSRRLGLEKVLQKRNLVIDLSKLKEQI